MAEKKTPHTIDYTRFEELVHIEALFKCLLNDTTDYIYFKDNQYRYMYGSRRFLELTRHSHWQELVGKDDFDIFDEFHARQYRAADEKVLAGERLHADENTYECLNGELRWLSTSKARITDENNDVIGMFGISRDITEMKTLQNRLNDLACYDSLTGLSNRHSFHEQGSALLAIGKPYALFFFDIDNFKYINDSLGHIAGDELIRVVADRLTSMFRATDMIARLGGDEFVVLVEMSSETDLSVIANKLQQTLNHPIRIETDQITVSCSVGVALYPDHADCINSLLDCADKAMYAAKEQGKSTVILFGKSQRHTNLISKCVDVPTNHVNKQHS